MKRIFLGLASLCGLVLMFVLWRHEHYLDSTRNTLIYFGLPLVFMGCFLAFTFVAKREFQQNALLVLVSCVLAIYTVELYLTFFWTQNRHLNFWRQTKAWFTGFDSRSKVEAAVEMRENGLKVFPRMSLLDWNQDCYRYDKPEYCNFLGKYRNFVLTSVPNVRYVTCNESGKYAFWEADEYGFNNPKGLYQTPVSIMIIGDSFAEGSCVWAREDIGSIIRETNPKTLNLGYLGIGPLLEYAILKEFGPTLKPQRVVWTFFEGNDLGDLKEELAGGFIRQYLDPEFNQDWMKRHRELKSEMESFLERVTQSIYHERRLPDRLERKNNASHIVEKVLTSFPVRILKLSALRLVAGLYRQSAETNEANAEDEIVPEFQTVIANAKTLVESWGGEFVFVYLPWIFRYQGSDVRQPDMNKVISIVESMGIKVINFDDYLKSQSDPTSFFPFHRNGHYNKKGHRELANFILKKLHPEMAQRPVSN